MSRAAIACWLAAWAFFGLPWGGVTSEPQIWNIRWTLYPGYRAAADAVLNAVFYMPLGVLGAANGWRWRALLATASLLSVATEWAQLYSPSRYPALPDVVFNVAGAAIGFAAAAVLLGRARSSAG